MVRIGVGARLFGALAFNGLVAFLIGLGAYIAFDGLHAGITKVTSDQFPAVVASAKLERQHQRIMRTLEQLALSEENFGRETIKQGLADQLDGYDRLLAELIAHPVCAPALAARGLTTPQEILDCPLIADRADAWPDWAARLAPGAPKPRPHLFDEVATALDSAALGGGVALVDQFAIEPYLETGRLVALPFAEPAGRKLALRSRLAGGKAEMADRLFMWLKLEIGRGAALFRERQAGIAKL